MRGRGALQEMDYRAVFGSMAKWVVEIDEVARIPEIISRAFHTAMQGRPGPVVIALPEDMLLETRRRRGRAARRARGDVARPDPDGGSAEAALGGRSGPIVVLGGSGWSETACARVRRFAERFDLPVATSFRRAMLFPGDHPNYAGEIGLGAEPQAQGPHRERRPRDPGRRADVRGAVAGLYAVRYSQRRARRWCMSMRTRWSLGKVYHPALGINATPPAFAAALETVQPPNEITWSAQTAAGARGLSGLDRAALRHSRPVPVSAR